MIKNVMNALFLVSSLSFSLGLASSHQLTQKNKLQQSRTQNSLTSTNARVTKNTNHKKTSPRNTASSRNTRKSQKYPPPPKDKSQFPQPIQDYIQAISDLCKIDSFEEQLQSMEAILKGLRDAVAFYTTHYRRQVSSGHINLMMGNLVEYDEMMFVWEPVLEKRQRIMDIAGQFLLVHGDLYNTPGTSEDIILLATDWAEPIYRGLYCFTKGTPTREKFKVLTSW